MNTLCFDAEVERLWSLGITGSGQVIGHLDTGVDATHPALAVGVREFRTFGDNGIDERTDSPSDSGWHGTHTASLISAGAHLKAHRGVAPDSRLVSGAVIERGAIVARLLSGLAWLGSQPVRIVFVGAGIATATPIFEPMLRVLADNGVLIVAPIGNDGAGRHLAPGDSAGVLSVGATDSSGVVAPFSGSANKADTTCLRPDVVAPGVERPGAMPGGGFTVRSGTSMAAAQIAGLAALLMEAVPGATATGVVASIVDSCYPLNPDQDHRSVAGLVSPMRALERLQIQPDALPPNQTEWSEGETAVDPRLVATLVRTPEKSTCDAALMFDDASALEDLPVDEGPQGAVRVKTIGAARAAIVRAEPGRIRELLDHPALRVASATDVDRSTRFRARM